MHIEAIAAKLKCLPPSLYTTPGELCNTSKLLYCSTGLRRDRIVLHRSMKV